MPLSIRVVLLRKKDVRVLKELVFIVYLLPFAMNIRSKKTF